MKNILKIAVLSIINLFPYFLIAQNANKASDENGSNKSMVYNINFNEIAARHQMVIPSGCRKNVEGKLVLKIPINTCKGAHDLYVSKSSGDAECDDAYLFFLSKACNFWNSEDFTPQKSKCEDQEFEYTVMFKK